MIQHFETYGTYDAFCQGGQTYPSKLSDNVSECVEPFKLMKPSMYLREIHEKLLNDVIVQM